MRKAKPYVDPRQKKLWPDMHEVYGIGRTWKETDNVSFFGDIDLEFIINDPVGYIERLTRNSLLQYSAQLMLDGLSELQPMPVGSIPIFDLINNETGE